MLEARGAEDIHGGEIRIAPLEDLAPRPRLRGGGRLRLIVFNRASTRSMTSCSACWPTGDAADSKGGSCANGTATAQSVGARPARRVDTGRRRNPKPSSKAMRALGTHGPAVPLPRADIAREVLADQLRERWGRGSEVAPYRTMSAERAPTRPGHLPAAPRCERTPSRSRAPAREEPSRGLRRGTGSSDLLRTTGSCVDRAVTAEARNSSASRRRYAERSPFPISSTLGEHFVEAAVGSS